MSKKRTNNKTVYDLAKFHELSMIDIVRSVKNEPKEKKNKTEINKIKEKIKKADKFNQRANYKIRQLRKIANDETGKYTNFQKLSALDSIDDINSGKRVAFKDNKGNEYVYQKIKTSHLRNTLNKSQGKDYYFYFNDGFKRYKVKRSKIEKMEDNSFFLNKLKKSIKEEIKKIESIKRKTKEQKKKVSILKDKLLKTIDFNLKLDNIGNKKIKTLPSYEQESIIEAFDESIDKEDKEGEYIMTVFFNGEDAFEF